MFLSRCECPSAEVWTVIIIHHKQAEHSPNVENQPQVSSEVLGFIWSMSKLNSSRDVRESRVKSSLALDAEPRVQTETVREDAAPVCLCVCVCESLMPAVWWEILFFFFYIFLWFIQQTQKFPTVCIWWGSLKWFIGPYYYKVSLGCKHPALKHTASSRRSVVYAVILKRSKIELLRTS